jgi:transposase-like protein
MIKEQPTVPLCPHCRRTTGVEEDDSTGSALRWFVCRLCGRRWSLAPKKSR